MGQADVKAAIRETRLANLAFLPAGSRRTDLKAVFDPEAISSCLEGLKQTFRFIFIDAPPLIPYADSLVLSSRADIVLLVLEADKTRLEVAREAVRRLSKMNISVFGTILNKKTFRIPSLIYKRL
jgi:Mrp family chromosome partitioning ATPase